MSTLVQFEWLIIELLVLGWLIWELVSVKRSLKRDREAAKARELQAASESPPAESPPSVDR